MLGSGFAELVLCIYSETSITIEGFNKASKPSIGEQHDDGLVPSLPVVREHLTQTGVANALALFGGHPGRGLFFERLIFVPSRSSPHWLAKLYKAIMVQSPLVAMTPAFLSTLV